MDIYSISTDVKCQKIREMNDSKEEEEARMINHAKPKELKVYEKLVATLTHVGLNFPWGEKNYLGTLEAHVDCFRYSIRDFHVDIMHANVQSYIFQHAHGGPPHLQFHLYQPIYVCGREEKDIQFCLFPTPPGEEKDAANIREDEHFLDTSRDKDLENFILRIEKIQETCRIDGIDHIPVYFEVPDFEFEGEFLNGALVSIGLTPSALVVLTETPFFVVPLHEIEIVNLALPDTETVDMTGTIDMEVVFCDCKRDVLKICSVPLKYLTGIKDGLPLRI